jgi:hypothetical protein
VTGRRVVVAVALCAVAVHIGALWNRFAMDDLYIIVLNPLVAGPAAPWRILAAPYWPVDFGGQLYRPLPVLTYALDRLVAAPAWFHGVNLVWHSAASAGVACVAQRLAGWRAALVAGLLFAVHPVHVEAVANVVGRAELMAGTFACLSVWAALSGRHPAWSVAAFTLALFCKENAAVTPALVMWAWMVGIARPGRRRGAVLVAGWVVAGAAWALARTLVLAPYARFQDLAPVFQGLDPLAVRLTAVSAFADVGRLLVAPVTLRADYSPLERVAVSEVGDPRFLLGVAIGAAWAVLLIAAWRRGRRVEALGLGWTAIAFLPVSNLVIPVGVLVAERTLYLPSAGLVIAVGAALAALSPRRWAAITAALVLAGAARSAARVPVWRDDIRLTASILEDSPDSYRGPARTGALLQSARQPERALEAYRQAVWTFDRDAAVFVAAADAAFTVGQPQLADSLLRRAADLCPGCDGLYRFQAAAARARGDAATAAALRAPGPGGSAP